MPESGWCQFKYLHSDMEIHKIHKCTCLLVDNLFEKEEKRFKVTELTQDTRRAETQRNKHIITQNNKYHGLPEGRGILSPLTMLISTSESLRSGNEL